jgi:hypothetical protein
MADDAQSVTPEELAKWLTPKGALALVAKAFGDEAAKAIWGRLSGGAIRAAAASSSQTEGKNNPKFDRTPTIIPARYWARISTTNGPNFWETGEARFWFPSARPRVQASIAVHCYAIRLNPNDLGAMLPADIGQINPVQQSEPPLEPAAETTKPDKPVNKGGRPPKDWWQDLWVEMCRQIYAGDLKFERQSQIETAMADWLSQQGYEAGEQTIRRAARKLFGVLHKEGQN